MTDDSLSFDGNNNEGDGGGKRAKGNRVPSLPMIGQLKTA